jgi:hypothetical protein
MSSAAKKSYVAPELAEFGSVADLTQRLGSGAEGCNAVPHIFDHGLGQGHKNPGGKHC